MTDKKTLDVMIDLETLGTRAGCGILSIGACTFMIDSSIYLKIDPQSCRERGLKEDPETLAWWHKQNPIARAEAFSGKDTLEVALGGLADWLACLPANKKDIYVWGNGADFDLPILSAAYEKVGMNVPWAPFNGRCFRTLKNLYFDVKAPIFEGMKHSALEDAKHQSRWARLILQKHFNKG